MASRRRSSHGRSSILPDPQGGWSGWVSFGRDPLTRKRIRKHVRGVTEADVIDKVSDLERARRTGGGPIGTDTTVARWLSHWLLICQETRKSSTYESYASKVTTHLVPHLGDLKLRELRPEHIELAFSRFTNHHDGHHHEPASAANKNAILRTLKAALSSAVERGLLDVSPARFLRPFAGHTSEIEPLTKKEIVAVLKAAGERRNGARWFVAMMLGLRQGEALGLKWSDIDFDRLEVTIRRALQQRRWRHGCDYPETCGKPVQCPRRRRPAQVTTPKSASGRRTMAISQHLAARLQQQRRDQVGERLKAGELWHDEDWVFAWRRPGR